MNLAARISERFLHVYLSTVHSAFLQLKGELSYLSFHVTILLF